MIRLFDVYLSGNAEEFLYNLLGERKPHESISHKQMPTYDEHLRFVRSRPYEVWYLIAAAGEEGGTAEIMLPRSYVSAGAIYLTPQREVGIAILSRYRSQGLGTAAIRELQRLHPGRLLANINPLNAASQDFFKRLGGKLIQVTYEVPPS